MDRINNLIKALTGFLKDNDAEEIAGLLDRTVESGTITFEDAERIVKGDIEDILLLALKWRLLLPVRAAKAGDWEDRMLIPRQGEKYNTPNVVRHLVKNALVNGTWNPEKAIVEVFESIGEPDTDKMPVLVERMASVIKGHRINGNQIKAICKELGLDKKVDPLVSELKACGILSHKLSSLTEVSKAGAPLYEINPSLLVG
jgi:hypothetical protein